MVVVDAHTGAGEGGPWRDLRNHDTGGIAGEVTSSAEIRSATKQSVMSDFRLRLMVTGLAAWTLFQTIRLVGVFLAQDALAGHASPAWLYPAITDVVVGLMASIVAFAVWRMKGLGVWVFGIVFFVISIVDHMDAVTAALTTPIPPAPLLFPSPVVTVGLLTLISVIDALAIAVLGNRQDEVLSPRPTLTARAGFQERRVGWPRACATRE